MANAVTTPAAADSLTGIDPIRRFFDARRARNSAYSLRALSRDLDLSPTYVSLLLNGKRRMPPELASQLAHRLGLSDSETRLWVKSLAGSSLTKDHKATPEESEDFLRLSIDRFRVLADWWCLAVLDLTLLDGFQEDLSWIAKRLGIQKRQAKQALDRCIRLGLLERDRSGQLKKTHAKLTFETTQSDSSIREFHRGMIHRALEELQHPERFDRRDISGILIATNPERVAEAKKRIANFQRSLLRFLGTGNATELYQFNTQLFPLTTPPHTKGEE
jgi:uncharacterized protein (TIGR02147 family)